MKIGRLSQAGALVVSLMFCSTVPATAAGDTPSQTVDVRAGAPAKVLRGTIKGKNAAEYTVRMQKGQTLSVTLDKNARSGYFNVKPAGAQEAIFVGSRDGREFEQKVGADGDYTIAVYLMRNAARRNESLSYNLTVGVEK